MLSVTFLGTGASIPTIDRNVAGLAVQREGETILFDCGEGSQRQIMRYGVGFSFKEIFFTHYHADHLLGVTGLLRTMGLQDRTTPVVLYGPKGAQRILGTAITLGIERNKFPVEILEIKPGDRLARDDYDIVVFATEHRADTVGFALVEHSRLGRFDPERARELGIPEGPLWGQLHKGKTVTLPDGRTVGPGHLVGTRGPAAAWSTPVIRVPTCRLSRLPGTPTFWSTRPPSAATSRSGPKKPDIPRQRRRPGLPGTLGYAGWCSPTSALGITGTRRSSWPKLRRYFPKP
jgi:ribonuclease BN (tRNA processing enzyme)